MGTHPPSSSYSHLPAADARPPRPASFHSGPMGRAERASLHRASPSFDCYTGPRRDHVTVQREREGERVLECVHERRGRETHTLRDSCKARAAALDCHCALLRTEASFQTGAHSVQERDFSFLTLKGEYVCSNMRVDPCAFVSILAVKYSWMPGSRENSCVMHKAAAYDGETERAPKILNETHDRSSY